VLAHIVLRLVNNRVYKSPTYLAIYGKAGEGKTSQTIASCLQKRITVVYCSSANFSGSKEGDAKQYFQKVYEKTESIRKSTPVVLVLDDFHKSVVNTDTSTTINTDLLTGYMMNIADQNDSIPVILTANELSSVYQPLLRFGRADIFEWKFEQNEKLSVVNKILSDIAQQKAIINFYSKYKSEPVSFFQQLKNRHIIDVIQNKVGSYAVITESELKQIDNDITSSHDKLNYSGLISLAEKAKKERGDF